MDPASRLARVSCRPNSLSRTGRFDQLLFMNKGHRQDDLCQNSLLYVLSLYLQCKNCDFRAGVVRKFSTPPHAFYTLFPLPSALTAHITSSQRLGLLLTRVCAKRSLQQSSVEAFGSCCYAYNNSQRPGLRTANAPLLHPPVSADAVSRRTRGKLLVTKAHPAGPGRREQRRPESTAPLNSSCAAGGSTAGGAARGWGRGRCAAAESSRRRRGARSPAPGEAAAPAPRCLAEAERMRMASGAFFCLLATISIVT